MFNILTLAKDHQKDNYNLFDSICDFLLYYNDRLHSTTKGAPLKVMINTSYKKFIKKENILKRRLKAKTVSVTYSDGSYGESQITLKYWQRACSFCPTRGLQKFLIKESGQSGEII